MREFQAKIRSALFIHFSHETSCCAVCNVHIFILNVLCAIYIYITETFFSSLVSFGLFSLFHIKVHFKNNILLLFFLPFCAYATCTNAFALNASAGNRIQFST